MESLDPCKMTEEVRITRSSGTAEFMKRWTSYNNIDWTHDSKEVLVVKCCDANIGKTVTVRKGAIIP